MTFSYSAPAADQGPSVPLTMNGFSVPAGGEVYKCQVFANPFSGTNTDILKVHSVISAGSHRFVVFSISSTLAAIEPGEAVRKRLAAVEARLAEQAQAPAAPAKPPSGKPDAR